MAVQLIITALDDGGVQVAGPLENKALCLKIIGSALLALATHAEPEKKPLIHVPQLRAVPKNGGGP